MPGTKCNLVCIRHVCWLLFLIYNLWLQMACSAGNLRTPVGKIPRPPWLRCWHLIVASAVDFSRLDGTSIWVRQLSKPGVWSCVLRGWPPPDHGGRSRAVQLRGWYGWPDPPFEGSTCCVLALCNKKGIDGGVWCSFQPATDSWRYAVVL